MADSIWGAGRQGPNPCTDSHAQVRTAFDSQSTYVLPVEGKTDAFISMADRWCPANPMNGQCSWLPIRFEGDQPAIRWLDSWLSIFD